MEENLAIVSRFPEFNLFQWKLLLFEFRVKNSIDDADSSTL